MTRIFRLMYSSSDFSLWLYCITLKYTLQYFYFYCKDKLDKDLSEDSRFPRSTFTLPW